MAQKKNQGKSKNQRKQRPNVSQIVFAALAVIIILSMVLSMIRF